jgi:UDP-GlcNAc:undecaprenyl-phosphate GlcNAc-1-phosphate transferase
VREYLLVCLVAATVTYLATPVARQLAVRIGAITPVRDRDVHSVPTPRLGGVAMLVGVLAAFAVASRLPLLSGVFAGSRDPQAMLSGAVLICLLGVADDKWGLDAVTKLAGQVLAAGVMAVQGVQLLWLPIGLGRALTLGPTESLLLTVLTVVVTVNAVNFADGLDGLAAGIVAIAAVAFFGYSYLLSVVLRLDYATPATLVTAALIGVCLGFLPHNFHPARLFMGDSGSMLIGLLLSTGAISLTGQLQPQASLPSLLPLLLPFAVILVPLFDMALAIIRRTWAGRAPWTPDKQHLHHRLLELGHSHARAVLILYFWSAAVAFSAAASAFLSGGALAGVVIGLLIAAVLASLRLPNHRAERPAR